MRPPNKGGPGLASPDLRKRIATTTFQHQGPDGGKDTAQATLDDYRQTFAEQARDTGHQAAERADSDWSEAAYRWIANLEAGAELSSDDVRREFGASGAARSVFRRAANNDLIRCIGITTSTAITRHRGVTRRWVRT